MLNNCCRCGCREYISTPVYCYPSTEAVSVALDVIRGRYGDGETRKIRLAKAGYCPYEIQSIVNMLIDFRRGCF